MGKDLNGKELGKGIIQRKDGRYMARYTDRYGRRRTLYNDKIKSLKQELNSLIYEDEHGIGGDGGKITLNQWYEVWKKTYKENTVSKKTIYKNESYYNARIRETLGGMYLKNIKLYHVQSLINDLFSIGLEYGTVSNIRSLLSEMFKKAVISDYLVKNPCDGIVMPKHEKKERRVLTREEQDIFFSVAADYLHIDVLRFAITTGCRIGEILGLKWEDIDFEGRTITIKRNLNYSRAMDPKSGSKFFFSDPKTASSKRTFYMTDEVYEILQGCKRKKLRMKLQKGDLWSDSEYWRDLVFTCLDGKPVYYSNINESLKKYVAQINMIEIEMAKEEKREPRVFEPITCHTFRHTFTTRCYENGIDQKVLKKLLGHGSLDMTDYYTHVTDEKVKLSIKNMRIL